MISFQAYVVSSPDHARLLFNAHPQLAYAFFQAMVLNNLVDPSVLEVKQPFPVSTANTHQLI